MLAYVTVLRISGAPGLIMKPEIQMKDVDCVLLTYWPSTFGVE